MEVRTIRVIFTAIPATETAKGLIIYNFPDLDKVAWIYLMQRWFQEMIRMHMSGIMESSILNPISTGLKIYLRNGSIIKNPPASFTYSGILYQEDIIDAFDNGSNEVGSIDTKVLAKGDVFVVKNGTSYFAVSIDNLNFTANDNLDNYQVSIMR